MLSIHTYIRTIPIPVKNETTRLKDYALFNIQYPIPNTQHLIQHLVQDPRFDSQKENLGVPGISGFLDAHAPFVLIENRDKGYKEMYVPMSWLLKSTRLLNPFTQPIY